MTEFVEITREVTAEVELDLEFTVEDSLGNDVDFHVETNHRGDQFTVTLENKFSAMNNAELNDHLAGLTDSDWDELTAQMPLPFKKRLMLRFLDDLIGLPAE